MLVTIDVGNSNITIGLFDGDEIKGTFRMTTKKSFGKVDSRSNRSIRSAGCDAFAYKWYFKIFSCETDNRRPGYPDRNQAGNGESAGVGCR